MKAKPIKNIDGALIQCAISECSHVELNFLGPMSMRIIPVILKGSRKSTNCWSWNGDIESPTLKPSILTDQSPEGPRCHSFVNDGMVKYLSDCTHELAGQSLPLLEVE